MGLQLSLNGAAGSGLFVEPVQRAQREVVLVFSYTETPGVQGGRGNFQKSFKGRFLFRPVLLGGPGATGDLGVFFFFFSRVGWGVY